MMDDSLNLALHHTIECCHDSSLGAWQEFSGKVYDEDLARSMPAEFSREKQIKSPLMCGESANRLCKILIEHELNNIVDSPESIDVLDVESTNQALVGIRKNTGRVLVRFHLSGRDCGHAYVFLGVYREGGLGNDVMGYIHQTNTGCMAESAFGLIEWVKDAKSKEAVNLEQHIDEIRKGFRGEDSDPVGLYQQRFMLSTKNLTDDEITKKKKPDPEAYAKLIWKPVNTVRALTRLTGLRENALASNIR